MIGIGRGARRSATAVCLAVALVVAGDRASAQSAEQRAEWNRPVEPFRIVGPVHFVGTAGLGSWLIATSGGHILIDGGLPETAPLIRRNVEALGFRIADVRYLLNSHAHSDHAGGLAELKRMSGARLLASKGDRPALEAGRHVGDNIHGTGRFPAVPVDGVIADGQSIELGGVKLTALVTPGHTKGCTNWTMRVEEGGRPLDIFFYCSLTVAGNRLVGNRQYPGIAEDYARSFARMRTVKADIVLPNHPEFVDLFARRDRARTEGVAAFVDPQVLPRLTGQLEAAFNRELESSVPQGAGK